jgi:hypothetical protein
VNFEIVGFAPFNDARSALEKGAQVLEQNWMGDEDVQGRRRAPELPQRVAPLTLVRIPRPSTAPYKGAGVSTRPFGK